MAARVGRGDTPSGDRAARDRGRDAARAEDGWVVASTPEVLGAMSQGQTRDEARANVIDALQLILSPEVGRDETESADREPLTLTIGG